jgi:polysaccharide pyruvyl transferase WcaK-like protein
MINDVTKVGHVQTNTLRENVRGVISPEVLGNVLKDPLFRNILQVNLTGGEPIHPELPIIGQILVSSLPKLQALPLIIQLLNFRDVSEGILALAQITQEANRRIEVWVSLDGVGEDHDRVHGVKGNFNFGVSVIETLLQNDIPVSVRCTLTPINCHGADDLLLWCEENNIGDTAFRIDINDPRLHNRVNLDWNAFSPEQRFHTLMFFEKLSRRRELSLKRQLYYRRILNRFSDDPSKMPLSDSSTPAVTLDMQGDLRYCPGQIDPIGSALDTSAWQLYKQNLGSQKNAFREECHDLDDIYGELNMPEIIHQTRDVASGLYRRRNKRIRPDQIMPKSLQPPERGHPNQWRHVLITGWYGTETAGDKAILGEVLHFISTHAPGCRITITTINRNISLQMQRELTSLQGAIQVDLAKANEPALIESVDAVIIAGGPLMEIGAMEHIWRIFCEANRQRKARVIFGCGVGPIHTDHITRITASILRMATAGFFRDPDSHMQAARLAPNCSFGYACDPAFAFVRRWAVNNQEQAEGDINLRRIIGLLRANTNEFVPDQSKNKLQESNREAARKIANILEMTCLNDQTPAGLLHMNAHWIGGDDRLFNRQIAGFFEDPGRVNVTRRYLPLDELLHGLNTASAAVTMRYHAHIFCIVLGIPFLSIDYTGSGGKVNSLVKRIGYENWSEDWSAINISRGTRRLQDLLAEREYWSAYLLAQTERLVDELDQVYSHVFQVPVAVC